jgi:D-xylose transport system ATP-binding protein
LDNFILEFENVTKKFPGVLALDGVSFKVARGSIHAICGENGAGKSTLMKILCGVYPKETYTGEVKMDGEVLKFTNDAIHQAIDKGIAIVHQELALVPGMTVGENIYLGKEPLQAGSINWNKLYSDTQMLLERYKLNISGTCKIKDISVGKQQMVEIAKALSEDAKILIFDEPTSALTDAEVETLMDILRLLRKQGKTCLYISHKLEELFEIADAISVFRDGAVVNTVKTSQTDHEDLISMMVGRKMTERFPVGNSVPSDIIMEVENLSVEIPGSIGKTAVSNVTFALRKGEILGIAGLMGAGRSELVTAIFGEYGQNRTGKIKIKGKEVRNRSAREAMKNGIGFVPEDRKLLGLITEQSILKNISLPNLDLFSGFFSINRHLEYQQAAQKAQELSVKTPTLNALANSLSGGNQQKVVIAKWLLSDPEILILDEPTRGIDVGAKYEIYKLMNKLTEQGMAIIMISSELPETMGMSHRIMVMCEGEVGGVLDKAEFTQEAIMSLATGHQSRSEELLCC